MDEIRDLIRRIGASQTVSTPDWDDVGNRHSRRMRRRRALAMTVGVSATVVVILVLFVTLLPDGGLVGGADSPGANAHFECDGSEISPAHQVVQAQPDGVHIRVAAAADGMGLRVEDHGGSSIPQGESEIAPPTGGHGWLLPPGIHRVRCTTHGDEGTPWAELTVVDPDGRWLDPTVRCRERTGAIGDVARPLYGDPFDLAREWLDRYPSATGSYDDLRRGGYAESWQVTVIAVRAGEVRAALTYNPSGDGGWYPEMQLACVDDWDAFPSPGETESAASGRHG